MRAVVFCALLAGIGFLVLTAARGGRPAFPVGWTVYAPLTASGSRQVVCTRLLRRAVVFASGRPVSLGCDGTGATPAGWVCKPISPALVPLSGDDGAVTTVCTSRGR